MKTQENKVPNKSESVAKLVFWLACNTVLGWIAYQSGPALRAIGFDPDGFVYVILRDILYLGFACLLFLTLAPILGALDELQKGNR